MEFQLSTTVITLTIILLVFLLGVLIISMLTKETKTTQSNEPRTAEKEIHENLIDSLNWLLQHNIITTTEYNQIITKSLPYLN